MGTHRAHIVFPEDLAAQIDEIAGARGRTAYIVDTMRAAVRRERLLSFLKDMEESGPVWKDEDHPELARLGTARYVHEMRRAKSERQMNFARKSAKPK